MKTVHVILLTAFAASLAALNPAAGQQERAPASGPLGTMPHGTYACALPGDAGGAAYTPAPAHDFRIIPASRYSTAQGEGTYLLRGRDLTFTQGPKKGERFAREGDYQLRKLNADGSRSELICTRTG